MDAVRVELEAIAWRDAMQTRLTRESSEVRKQADSFLNPLRGMDRETRMDALFDLTFGEGLRHSAINWIPIKHAIRRGGLFVLEASTPACHILLRFHPEDFTAGDYQIHFQRPPKDEQGGIERVDLHDFQQDDAIYSAIAHCTTVYRIITYARQGGKRTVWFVGLSKYRESDEAPIE